MRYSHMLVSYIKLHRGWIEMMNILEIAIKSGLPDFSFESSIECFVDKINVEAFAAAIAHQAIDEFKASLVPVAYADYERGNAYLIGTQPLNEIVNLLYALPIAKEEE